MRFPLILLACGVALSGCTDSTAPTSTAPAGSARANLSTDEAPLVAQNGKGDFVVGHGEFVDAAGQLAFHVAAHSGPLGEDPRGHVSVASDLIFPFQGTVTCLFVQGNHAVVGTDRPRDQFGGFYLILEDNGDGSVVPDRFVTGVSDDGNDCAAFLPFALAFLAPIAKGDVTIRDALPAVP